MMGCNIGSKILEKGLSMAAYNFQVDWRHFLRRTATFGLILFSALTLSACGSGGGDDGKSPDSGGGSADKTELGGTPGSGTCVNNGVVDLACYFVPGKAGDTPTIERTVYQWNGNQFVSKGTQTSQFTIQKNEAAVTNTGPLTDGNEKYEWGATELRLANIGDPNDSTDDSTIILPRNYTLADLSVAIENDVGGSNNIVGHMAVFEPKPRTITVAGDTVTANNAIMRVFKVTISGNTIVHLDVLIPQGGAVASIDYLGCTAGANIAFKDSVSYYEQNCGHGNAMKADEATLRLVKAADDGSTDSGSNNNGYTGKTTPASINNKAEAKIAGVAVAEAARYAKAQMKAGDNLPFSVVTKRAMNAADSRHHRVEAVSLQMAKLASTFVDVLPVGVTAPLSAYCTSGSVQYSGPATPPSSGNFSRELTFNKCTPNYNQQITQDGVITITYKNGKNHQVIYTNYNVTYANGGHFTLNGTYTYKYCNNNGSMQLCGIDSSANFKANGTVYASENLSMTFNSNNGTYSFTEATLCDPSLGCMTIKTQTPLQFNSSCAYPTGGIIAILINNSLLATISFSGCTTITVDVAGPTPPMSFAR